MVSTQCVNTECDNYSLSWANEILNTTNLNVIRHSALDKDNGGFIYKSKTVESFTGQVLFYARHNSYWSIPAKEVFADPDNIPKPECYSVDGKEGSLHGECTGCVYNMYGSGFDKINKACRQQIKLYLRPTSEFLSDEPIIFWVSPLNMNAFQNELLHRELLDKGYKYPQVEIKLTSYLSSTKTFRRVEFSFESELDTTQKKEYDAYRQDWLERIKLYHANPRY